jgi:SPP1 gp7 family putative phage head morphogenesis protein
MYHVTRAEEMKLYRALRKLFLQMIEDVRKGSGLLNGVSERVRTFMQSDEVDRYLTKVIKTMSMTIRNSSARSWREAASRGHRGPEIYNLIKNEMHGPVGERVWAIIADNAAYIKTLPQEWARFANQYAAREAMRGKRPEQVEAELRAFIPAHMQKNLKTIARTECAKANATIVQARAEMCGIKAYFWRAMADERTRSGHAKLDGVLVFYDDPPSPEALVGERSYGKYHAGNTFNCRCYQEPVVDVSFLPDVVSVYSDGKIYTTSKGALLRKFGNVA